jgi:hypothetical protein
MRIPPVVVSYARVFVAAMITLYLAGERDWGMLWQAGVGAVLPPVLRWLNKDDHAFGRGA